MSVRWKRPKQLRQLSSYLSAEVVCETTRLALAVNKNTKLLWQTPERILASLQTAIQVQTNRHEMKALAWPATILLRPRVAETIREAEASDSNQKLYLINLQMESRAVNGEVKESQVTKAAPKRPQLHLHAGVAHQLIRGGPSTSIPEPAGSRQSETTEKAEWPSHHTVPHLSWVQTYEVNLCVCNGYKYCLGQYRRAHVNKQGRWKGGTQAPTVQRREVTIQHLLTNDGCDNG